MIILLESIIHTVCTRFNNNRTIEEDLRVIDLFFDILPPFLQLKYFSKLNIKISQIIWINITNINTIYNTVNT